MKGAFSWSIRKTKKQCKRESSSAVRRALLSLLEVHERECKMYLEKPEAHPNYNMGYREFVDQKTKSIVDLGGDPNDYDFEQDWKKYWPVQMYKLFLESWNTKMRLCTSLIQKKYGSSPDSSHSSSQKSKVKHPPKRKRRLSEQESEGEIVNLDESNEKVKTITSSADQQSNRTDPKMHKKQKEMNCEIFSVLKLLNHIKHRFNECEASFDKLYVKAMNLKEDNSAIKEILQSNIPLLDKIDEKLKETVKDVNLTIIQKAVIQETLQRFRSIKFKHPEISSEFKWKTI